MEELPAKTIYLGMEKSDSYVRDVLANKQGVMLDDVPKLLSVVGLKIVPIGRICITPEEKAHYDACKVIAAQALNPKPLDFEDPE